MKSILIIEDEEALRILLHDLLRGAGYRVYAAAGGQQGVRLARAHRPDLVLTDIRMPGMDGHETVAQLRRLPGFDAVPVIMMTAHAALPDMRKGMNGGADDYVAKPFGNDNLLQIVAQHLGKAAGRRRAAGRELEQLRQRLGELLPGQFETPLHDIIGCASVLALDADVMPPGEVREFARNIEDAAARLHRQIENLLLYTQLEAGTATAGSATPTDVAELLRRVAERAAACHDRRTTLKLQLPACRALLAPEPFAKAVAELMDNACRHAGRGGTVTVTLEPTDHGFGVVIADQGPGLPADVPLDGTAWRRHEEGGAGLGLYLSRRLTQLLGGAWEIGSVPGQGTTACLRLPAARCP